VPDPYARPDGVDDATVAATGTLSEALEWVERARGRLYDFHQMIGHADALLVAAADALAEAGHTDHADRLRRELVGRNVLRGRWTFQVIEEFDDTYWSPLRDAERRVRDDLLAGVRHLFEAELKERTRSDGHPHHERGP
jgi:hypothetical protein